MGVMSGEPLCESDQQTLLSVARERIAAALEQREPTYPAPSQPLLQHGGAFVTIHIRRAGVMTLRGCIGHIEPHDTLFDTVKSVAYSSAFQDYRFQPLTSEEYPEIQIEISILSALEEIDDPAVVQPGTHGLYIKAGGRAGLLLPQVASEQRWGREQFLEQTCRKAGLPTDAWRQDDTSISVFTAQVFGEPVRT